MVSTSYLHDGLLGLVTPKCWSLGSYFILLFSHFIHSSVKISLPSSSTMLATSDGAKNAEQNSPRFPQLEVMPSGKDQIMLQLVKLSEHRCSDPFWPSHL